MKELYEFEALPTGAMIARKVVLTKGFLGGCLEIYHCSAKRLEA